MNEEEALFHSTNWINGKDNLFGYLPFVAANYLIKTGKYDFHDVHFWGYIVRKKSQTINEIHGSLRI